MVRRVRPLSLAVLLASLAGTYGCAFHFQHSSVAGSWLFDPDSSASREDEVALELAKGEALELDGGFGRIEVTVAAAGPYRVTAKLTLPGVTREEAERDLTRFSLKAKTAAGRTRVWIDGDPVERAVDGGTMVIRPDVHCVATVPPGIALSAVSQSGDVVAQGPFASADAKSAFGRVTVSDADGRVRAESSSGDVSVESVRGGGKTEARSAFGKVSVVGVEAEEIVARSDSGDVTLRDVRARDVQVVSSFGKLDLARISGSVRASTKSGSVLLDTGRGSHELRSGFGGVRVKRSSGELQAVTSSGDVDVDDFEGSLRCESSFGKISVTGVLAGLDARTNSGRVSVRALPGSRTAAPWSVRSGFGDLVLELPADFSAVLDAATTFGSIETGSGERAASVRGGGSRVREGLGSGGEKVTLETSSGNVRIRRAAK